MSEDRIRALVEKAHGPITGQWWDMDLAALKRFAALVAEDEREECARLADAQADDEPYGHAKFRCTNIAAEIRARGDGEAACN